MNPGKEFEKDIKDSLPAGGHYTRLRDPILQNRDAGGGYVFGDRCPYDFEFYLFPKLFCAELKSTAGTSISYAGSNPMIKRHQIMELLKASKIHGVLAGLILNYRKTGGTYWIDIRDFGSFADQTSRKSLNEMDCMLIGAAIPWRIPKGGSRRKYDLSAIMEIGQIRLEE